MPTPRVTGKKTKKVEDPVSVSGEPPLLVEIAHEVCQQVGGIYTVLRSKVPSVVAKRGENYLLLGPYNPQISPSEFEPTAPEGVFGQAFESMRQRLPYEIHYGRWLVTGKPRVILMNPRSAYGELDKIKYELWEKHGIPSPGNDDLYNQVVAFGKLIELFLQILAAQEKNRRRILAHFHEWMSGSSIADIRKSVPEVATLFTTHATFLGRCLAVNDPRFYDHLPFYKWQDEAKKLNIEPQNLIERIAANSAHVFTTVSDLTALECKYLLGREVDLTLPNGINLERFVASHESQVLHQNFKEQIHQFTMSHFFPSYSFDLDKTLYFFTSGRYEYRNKGFDLTLESLARLNWRLKQAKSPLNVVVFFITKRPFRHIIPDELGSRAMMDEIRASVEAIKEQVGERLFLNAAMGEIPDLNDLVDEYWNLRLRRNLQAWKSSKLPTIVTHSLYEEASDEILAKIRTCRLINEPGDPVKVVYHPDFVTANNPLFGMDYDQFVRGCHLGIFPSYYEPWGYTPLECIARGIPAVTSDLSGFGSYLLRHMPDSKDKGIYIAKRHVFSYEESANQLTDYLFDFVKMERRERIALRNEVEKTADSFDWMKLGAYYDEAYVLAEKRV